MTEMELGITLKRMYENAKFGEAVVNIHLFGIKYGEEILDNNYSSKKIIKNSGLKKSYLTELSKGIKLSKYVIVKNFVN